MPKCSKCGRTVFESDHLELEGGGVICFDCANVEKTTAEEKEPNSANKIEKEGEPHSRKKNPNTIPRGVEAISWFFFLYYALQIFQSSYEIYWFISKGNILYLPGPIFTLVLSGVLIFITKKFREGVSWAMSVVDFLSLLAILLGIFIVITSRNMLITILAVVGIVIMGAILYYLGKSPKAKEFFQD